MEEIKTLAEFGVTKHEKVLDNGLRTIFIEKPFSPIYAKLIIGAGSVFNPSDNGLAHMTEHLFMNGSRHTSREDFWGMIENIGGFVNAYTNKSEISVEAEIADTKHLPIMSGFFSEALTTICVDEDSLNKEKEIVFSEIQRRIASTPMYSYSMELSKKLTNNSAWGYSNLGTIEAMRALSVEDVEGFFCKHFVVENMVLVISGGCSLVDIENSFGKINFLHGNKFALPSEPQLLPLGQRFFYETDYPQASLIVGFNGAPVGSRDSCILNFVLDLSHNGSGSIFYKNIRSNKGLVYAVNYATLSFNKTRYFGTDLGVPIEKVDDAIEATLECYNSLLFDGVTQKDVINRANIRWSASKRHGQRSVDWVERFDDCLHEDDNPVVGDFPDYYNFLYSLTADEINTVIKKYIKPDRFHLYLAGKQKSKKYF